MALFYGRFRRSIQTFCDFYNLPFSPMSSEFFTSHSLIQTPMIYRILPNKHACLNKCAPQTWLYLAISQNTNQSESKFSALIVDIFKGSQSKSHWNLTSIKACFLPLRPARLFGEIQYEQIPWNQKPLHWSWNLKDGRGVFEKSDPICHLSI